MPDAWPVHTVVFDLDDTLYPERDYVLSGFAAVGAWLERERGILGFEAQARSLFAAGHRGKIFDEALVILGVANRADVGELVEVYRSHSPKICLPDESARILAWATIHFRVALLSDGYLDVQRRKADALKLSQWIKEFVFSDQWGREFWKPSLRPFQEVMLRFPGLPSGYLYVGDNPRKDFIAPRALGWRTVCLRREGGENSSYVAGEHEVAEREVADLRLLQDFLVANK